MRTPSASTHISIFIIAEHPMLREGVAAMIRSQPDMTIVASASTGEEGIAVLLDRRPDVALMDIEMLGTDGSKAIAFIRGMAPDTKILVLTTYAGDVQALQALRAGAAGFLLKSNLRRELIGAIRSAYAGRKAVAPSVDLPPSRQETS